ncbi:DUF2637 domain-containing protein [Rhodococcus sp. D2-41]|uniref:DUF2637 domain-containing protein n=1 Tax=Speluncibacter jeojiensis TaxID=2710754 RepID=UPI00240F53EB|nr:DUF2637 domain-containing protein [Rhodococcus sp. D2-41]MDG3012708.1 DUF2637 domain-containing protein [Rhodococcus sp. D2-41]
MIRQLRTTAAAATCNLHAAATAGIALLAFALSYSNLAALAGRAGYSPLMAHTWPFVVDGLAVVATVAVMRLRARRTYAWSLLGAATTVSVVAGAAAHLLPAGPLPGWAGAVVAVVPPLCLLVAPHLAVQLRRDAADATTDANATDAAAPTRPDAPAPTTEDAPAPAAIRNKQTAETECDTRDGQPERTVTHPAVALFDLEATHDATDRDASQSPRDRALHLLDTTDMSQRAVALAVGTSEATVRRWRKAADAPPALVAVGQ